ncbi:energy-coupling factor transporter ATPase [Mycoplasmatota bacterium]|nr:energy-coupling factor transporter ATPase [Mycoplasmatota bacterium]
MNIIEIKDLSFLYSEEEGLVLRDINLNIEKGEWVAILGHNGSGKSTLSKLIVGLLEKKSGSIIVNEKELCVGNEYEIRESISIVFQNPDNQFVGATVKDDIAFGLENQLLTREEMIKRIDYYSKKVNMHGFLNKEPHNLSGGEKQRVAIAGALAMDTEIIILDEATSMLDPRGKSEVIETIKSLQDGDKTIITITHELSEAVLCDRVIVLNKGRIVLDGAPKEVFKERELIVEAGLDILPTLKVLDKLEEENIDNDKLKEILWELSLTM